MNTLRKAVEDIKCLKISHRNWQAAVAESFALLSVASPGDVICITGPSRAGKTRLIKELMNLLCGEDRFNETGLLPAVMVNATNTGQNGTFSTKGFTERMLQAIRHPVLSIPDDYVDDDLSLHKIDRTTESVLRGALERGLKRRQTRYFFIDEAQHARFVSKGAQGAFAVMDSWKCLAGDAELVLIVSGAYPILSILHNSPHLLGRKDQIHLPRYQATAADLAEFGRILAAYDQIIEKDKSLPSLLDEGKLLFSGSFGCIGLLRKWLVRAAAIGMARESPVSLNLLRETKMPYSDLQAIAAEIRIGEQYLSSDQEIAVDGDTERSSRGRKKGKKPFQRDPKRMKPGNRTAITA